MALTPSEQALLNELNTGVNSFDEFFDESADAPIVAPIGMPRTQLSKAKGNPAFSAQFDITVLLKYFTVVTATGVYTPIAAAALDAGLKNQLPAYVFGHSDFAAGYANIRRYYPLTGWVHERPLIYGASKTGTLTRVPEFDANVTALLQNGDMVLAFSNPAPGAGTTTVGLVIVRCTQVPYGVLLNALSSDRFVINGLRYVIPDSTKLAQYSNNIGVNRISLFGKADADYVSPNSFKKPEQQQNGLIDIPLKRGIDKNIALATYVNYDCIELSWSIFVFQARKLTA